MHNSLKIFGTKPNSFFSFLIFFFKFEGDTQSELPIDSANEFSSQSSTLSPETQEELRTTFDQITTEIPLRLSPQSSINSRPKQSTSTSTCSTYDYSSYSK